MNRKPPLQFWFVVHVSKLEEEDEPYVDISRPFTSEGKAERELDLKKEIWEETHQEDEELNYDMSSFRIRKVSISDHDIDEAERQDKEEYENQMEVARIITKGILEDSEDNKGDKND